MAEVISITNQMPLLRCQYLEEEGQFMVGWEDLTPQAAHRLYILRHTTPEKSGLAIRRLP